MKRIVFKLLNRHHKRFSRPSAADAPPEPVPQCSVQAPVLLPQYSPAKYMSERLQLNAPLENLPPEVRHQLCSLLRLDELSALVHASPVFHQQYLRNRRSLLAACLETTLGIATVDACAVFRSNKVDFREKRTREMVTHVLQSYQSSRSSTQHSIRSEKLTENEAVDIVGFYSSVINPIVQHYTRWALGNLPGETGKLQGQEPLSRTEETRFLRAFYRFQLCCNLFGKGHYGTSLYFRSVEILKLFFCLFEPWEVEEISCVYAFSKETYSEIFNKIRWDVDEKTPKFDGQRPPTPDGAFDLDNSWVHDSLLKGTISRGLELLHTVLFTITDHAHLVSVMQKGISWPAGDFLEDEALGESAQHRRRREQLSSRDLKQQRRDPLPFEGDSELDNDLLGPPLVWTLIWKGTYSNLYGEYLTDNIRRWGYVMWDAARLERAHAKDVLMWQWEEDWGDTDPRDNM